MHHLVVSGGFATVHPNNKLTINAIEAYQLEQFSPEVSFYKDYHAILVLMLSYLLLGCSICAVRGSTSRWRFR